MVSSCLDNRMFAPVCRPASDGPVPTTRAGEPCSDTAGGGAHLYTTVVVQHSAVHGHDR